jgi:hypothetical protein
MGTLITTPLRAKDWVVPFMRPMPAIFTYARLTLQPGEATGAQLADEFRSLVAALGGTLDAACHEVGIPEEGSRVIRRRCTAAAELRGQDLAGALDRICADLVSLQRTYRRELKRLASNEAELFRELYRRTVRPKKIMVIFSGETQDQSERLERKLTERCYYDYEAVGEDWVSARPRTADLVAFVPGERPIPVNILEMVEACSVPMLILMGSDGAADAQNMALLKTEHLYRKSGYSVLRSPFTPLRLYQTIDAILMRHLAGAEAAVPLPATDRPEADAAAA